jgi:small subunit ribosomal protein S15
MLTKEKKRDTVAKFGSHAKDTGNPTAQIALLTERINDLMGHFAKNPKEMVGQRRRLLGYLRRNNPKRYLDILRELNLRK